MKVSSIVFYLHVTKIMYESFVILVRNPLIFRGADRLDKNSVVQAVFISSTLSLNVSSTLSSTRYTQQQHGGRKTAFIPYCGADPRR